MSPGPLLRLALLAAGAMLPFDLSGEGGLDRAVPVAPFLDGRLPPGPSRDASGGWVLENAFPGLDFVDPVQMIPFPGTGRLLLVEKIGRLVSFENDPAASAKRVLLDLAEVTSSLDDSGMLGAVFHPEFALEGSPNRDYLYVYYRYTPDRSQRHPGYRRLSRFTWDAAAEAFDPASESILINQFGRSNWHNGGGLFFGSDGFLYLSVGDEGGGHDNFQSAQRLDGGLFAGILRIDVDCDPERSHPIRRQPLDPAPPPPGWPSSFSQGYGIPKDNPWLSPEGETLEEYWAVGLRSPHRATYDFETGRIWVGDVGQYRREEINVLEAGGANLQWPYREGELQGESSPPSVILGTEHPPFLSYGRSDGGCVIGGYVYRGSRHPELYGKYLFGDYSNGAVRTLEAGSDGSPEIEDLLVMPRHGPGPKNGLGSFGIDAEGELYLLSLAGTNSGGGIVYRLARSLGEIPEPPATLSQTGAFLDLAALAPAPGLIPYEPIQGFWSDGAEKWRWIAIPNDGKPDGPGERIAYSETGEWTFPVGTVFVKHFEFGDRKVETRFLLRGEGGEYFGFTYRWRPDQSDADLLPGDPLSEEILIPSGESVSWHFPGRLECFACHTAAAGTVLGLKTRHLNGDLLYPGPGRVANQLVTLNQLGFLSPPLDLPSLGAVLTSARLDDDDATLERRARTYLDVNCSHCHRADGTMGVGSDARLSVPPYFQNLIHAPASDAHGVPGAVLVQPGNEVHSVLHQRMASLDPALAMPPLARSRVDEAALALVAEWIRSLDPDTSPQGPVEGPAPADHTPPALSVDPPGGRTIHGPLTLRLSFSESVLGFEREDIVAENASLSELLPVAGGAETLLTLTPLASGPVSLVLPSDRLTDLAGNANRAAGPWTYDYIEPVLVSGLRYDYYELGLTQMPDFSTLVPTGTGVAHDLSMGARLRDEGYAFRFYGDLELSQGGVYEFVLVSKDGSRLWIDGELVVDNDGLHAVNERRGTLALGPGRHRIEIAAFNGAGPGALQVLMGGPGMPMQPLPFDRLSHYSDGSAEGGGAASIRAFFYPDASVGLNAPGIRRYQPDNWIGRTFARQIGNRVYNSSGAGQTLALRFRRGEARALHLTVENDRLVEDSPVLRATRGGRAFKALFRSGKRNVTAAMRLGRLRVGPLAAGETASLRGSIRPVPRFEGRRARARIAVSTVSAHPGIPLDRVRVRISKPAR